MKTNYIEVLSLHFLLTGCLFLFPPLLGRLPTSLKISPSFFLRLLDPPFERSFPLELFFLIFFFLFLRPILLDFFLGDFSCDFDDIFLLILLSPLLLGFLFFFVDDFFVLNDLLPFLEQNFLPEVALSLLELEQVSLSSFLCEHFFFFNFLFGRFFCDLLFFNLPLFCFLSVRFFLTLFV